MSLNNIYESNIRKILESNIRFPDENVVSM
jgi:hypothetical protein